MKKQFVVISLCILLISSVHAVVVYKNGVAEIKGEHELKDINNTEYLEIKDDICYLKKPVKVTSTAILDVTDASCKKLNMYPDAIIKIYGKIYFKNIHVTSFDPATGQPIELSRTSYSKKRPDITTKSPAQYFYAENTEFSHLGYYYNSSDSHWGVSLKYLPTAKIINSKFHDNYFGLYTFESKNVEITNSEIYDNLEYGLDFHDYSDNFIVSNNRIYRNGNHGLIFSKYCVNNLIQDNKIFDHTQNAFQKGVVKTYGTHGIMLHLQSNNNHIEGNELWNNREAITLQDSDDNLITENIIYSDKEKGIKLDESHGNQVSGNTVEETEKEPFYSFNSFDNSFTGNTWGGSDDKLYIKIQYPNGSITRLKFTDPGADNKLNQYQNKPW